MRISSSTHKRWPRQVSMVSSLIQRCRFLWDDQALWDTFVPVLLRGAAPGWSIHPIFLDDSDIAEAVPTFF